MKLRTVSLPSGLVVPWDDEYMVWLHHACPDRHEHDPLPADFSGATGRSKTHRQARHKRCGLWTQWIPRTKKVAS